MVSRLALLQSRLTWLRRLRVGLRWGSALAGVVASCGAAILCVAALDWLFSLGILERLFVIGVAFALVAWSSWGMVRWLGHASESDLDVALLVEKQHDIDSDLIAALQFDRRGNTAAESPQLASAVVNYVAAALPTIDVFHGVSAASFLKALSAAVTLALVIAALAFSYPGHARAFWNRLLLGSQAYPSRTQISQVFVGQTTVYDATSGASPRDATAAEGSPVEFKIVCTGALPSKASVQIQSVAGSSVSTSVELLPVSSDARSSVRGQFVGRLPRLVEDATYKIMAGDARTPPARLRMIPLPIVDLELDIQPPTYAAVATKADEATGAAVSALEGSTLAFSLHAINRKPLQSVTLKVQAGGEVRTIPFAARDEQRVHWASPPNLPALENLRGDMKYEVHVLDDDGLAPLSVPRGSIRVRPDASPVGAIELVHRVVLPTARPVLGIRAADDYGIAGIELLLDVERGDDTDREINGESPSVPAAVTQTHRYPVFAASEPVTGDQLPFLTTYTLDLAPLQLSPGDRLRLSAEITDYRGQQARLPGGAKATTESRLLEIADESGVLAAIREGDQRTEQQLNELIRRQLQLGETP